MEINDRTQGKPQKRKHITLTIQEKLDIIELVEKKVNSRQAIANRYGIGKSTVHDIHKRRNEIRSFAMETENDLAKRRRLDVAGENSRKRKKFDEIEFDEEVKIETKEEDFMIEQVEEIEDENAEELADEQQYTLIYEEEIVEKQQTGKRRSNTLTIRQKYDILKQLENGMSVPSICKCYSIGRTTVYDFIKYKQKIIDYIEKSSDENRKTFKKSNYPEVEEKMINWCEERENFTKHDFYNQCKISFVMTESTSSFCGSWSWCKRFFDRHPQFKGKLVKADGMPLDKSDLEITKHEDTKNFNVISKFRKLEKSLHQWCLEQKTELTNELIIDAAREFAENLELANFNPTSSWVQKYLQKHPDINCICIEEVETEFLPEEDYIVEELDESVQSLFEVEDEVEEEVTEDDAKTCLSMLIKFSQQRGISELENMLHECKEVLMNSIK